MPLSLIKMAQISTTLFLLSSACAYGADLTVNISDIQARGGKLQISIFDKAQTFEQTKIDSAYANLTLPANGYQNRFTLHNVPAGQYAISILHDENGNQMMDNNKTNMPEEGYGTSKARDKYDEPSFVDASIKVSGKNESINVKMFYMGSQ